MDWIVTILYGKKRPSIFNERSDEERTTDMTERLNKNDVGNQIADNLEIALMAAKGDYWGLATIHLQNAADIAAKMYAQQLDELPTEGIKP
jgi:Flp pilus assembly CpaE family ATPase